MAAADTIATLSERVAKLEEANRARSEAPDPPRAADPTQQATKIAAVEATLPYLATKSDIAEVRTEAAKNQTSTIRWFVGTTLTIIALLITLFGIVIGLIVTRLP